MLLNYLKLSLRNLIKHKAFSIINIGGLTLGITACLLIMFYASFELSYDRFHENGNQIYRLKLTDRNQVQSNSGRARVPGLIGPEIEQIYPEVQRSVRLINLHGIMGNLVMQYEEKQFTEEKMYYTDADILELFSFELLSGNRETALQEPYRAVITESTARKYFGDSDPLGKSIVMNGEDPYTVTGILADIPENSHLKFDFLLSFDTIRDETYMLGWADFLTYIQLRADTDTGAFNSKLISSNILAQKMGDSFQNTTLALQPLHDIHLRSNLEGEAEVNGSLVLTYSLIIVAFLILIIAWVNYINLSTARSFERAKEVGIRKVVGAPRKTLIRQFLFESVAMNLIAMMLAIILVMELLPLFNRITGKSFQLSLNGRPDLWIALIGIMLTGVFLSSLYPAFALSSFKPINILKGKLQSGKSRLTLQRLLVIFQFAVSIALLTGTLTVYEQITFMRSKELGIEIDRTLIVKGPSITDESYADRLKIFKNELSEQSQVSAVTVSSNIPGRESTWGGSTRLQGQPVDENISVDYVGIDYDFIGLYGLNLLAGRNFSMDFESDQQAVLINERALQNLGFGVPEAIIGKKIHGFRNEYTVIGVTTDHHQLSMRSEMIPTIYYLRPGNFYSIKLTTEDLSGVISLIQSEFEQSFPGNPFEYFFLDSYFNRQYQADRRFGTIFGIFTGLAIFIACLGLFALSSYTAVKRTKEIGIRKVLGASLPGLLTLLSKDFLTLVMSSILIALPLAWIGVDEWLAAYAYRIEPGPFLFALPVVVVLVISLITVSVHAIKTARTNPVATLRNE